MSRTKSTKAANKPAATSTRSGLIGRPRVDADFARHAIRRIVMLLISVAAGLTIYASFPPRNWWFLAPLGVALITIVIARTRTLRGGFGYGFVTGLAFMLALLPWIGAFVGDTPYIALCLFLALYYGLFGMFAVRLTTYRAAPIWIACAWTAGEWLRSIVPFGGFPWGRLAFSQGDGWFLSIASLAGAPGVTFAVALVGTSIGWAIHLMVARRNINPFARPTNHVIHDDETDSDLPDSPTRRTLISRVRSSPLAMCAVYILAVAIVAAILWPAVIAQNKSERTIVVAAIQGNVPRLGYDMNTQREAVLKNHVNETLRLAEMVKAGKAEQPDIVIWPENSSDIDPTLNPGAADLITAASLAVKAPILVGTINAQNPHHITNTVVAWNGAHGPGEHHDKVFIQPFGEYVPWRSFFRHFSSWVDRANNLSPGEAGPANDSIHVDEGPARDVSIGVAICYEVAFDPAFESSVAAGAQFLTVPANDATFKDTEMTYQQMGMSQVRAVEFGRQVVVATTSGSSAMIAPDGTVTAHTPTFTPAILDQRIPLHTQRTVASYVKGWPEIATVILTVFMFFGGVWQDRRVKRARNADA